jgi:hypothetical protein
VSKYSDRPSATFAGFEGFSADGALSGRGAKTAFQLESSATAAVVISEVVRIARTRLVLLFMNSSCMETDSG